MQNAVLVPKADADLAFDYATCIGCGACVAACPNASASLFTAAKVGHLALLPQGQTRASATGDGHDRSKCLPKDLATVLIMGSVRRFVLRGFRLGRSLKCDESILGLYSSWNGLVYFLLRVSFQGSGCRYIASQSSYFAQKSCQWVAAQPKKIWLSGN